jgi:hypothetical protein
MPKLAVELRYRPQLGHGGNRRLHLLVAYDIAGAYDHEGAPCPCVGILRYRHDGKLDLDQTLIGAGTEKFPPTPAGIDRSQCRIFATA